MERKEETEDEKITRTYRLFFIIGHILLCRKLYLGRKRGSSMTTSLNTSSHFAFAPFYLVQRQMSKKRILMNFFLSFFSEVPKCLLPSTQVPFPHHYNPASPIVGSSLMWISSLRIPIPMTTPKEAVVDANSI